MPPFNDKKAADDSGSDLPDDWEEDEDAVVTTLVKEKSPAVLESAEKKAEGLNVPKELLKPLSDPNAERERQQLLAEARDIEMGGAHFGVSAQEFLNERSANLLAGLRASAIKSATKKDTEFQGNPLDFIQLGRMQDVETLCDAIVPKIEESAAKSQTWLRFLDRLIVACSARMEPQDIKTLSKKLFDIQKTREKEKNLAATKSKKGTDLKPNLKDPMAELAIYEGGYDDEEAGSEVDDEYADFL